MKKRSTLAQFAIRVVFAPGLFLWGIAVRAGMLITRLRSGASIQGRLLLLALRGYRYWTTLKPQSLAELRLAQEKLGTRIRTAPEVRFEETGAPGRPSLWAIPAKARKGKVILFFHGGGYTTGSIITHRALVSHIASVSGVSVLSVGYRLAPEHPYPAALMDATAAYDWLLSTGYKPGDIALAGDSAGGGLATVLLVHLRDRGNPHGNGAAALPAGAALPVGAALLSPWVDLSDSRNSWEKLASTDWLLTPESLQDDARKYLGASDPSCPDLMDPYVSPRYANLAGLPPLLVHVGGDELLRDDILAFVDKARRHNVKVSLGEWPGMFHDWHLMVSYLPEGRKAVDEVGIFLKIMLA